MVLSKGLPQEWEALLNSGAISKEEVLEKPDEVLSCLEVQSNFISDNPKPIRTQEELPDEKSISLSLWLLFFVHSSLNILTMLPR